MPVQLTSVIRIAGTPQPVGTILTLPAEQEAEYVQRGVAVYVSGTDPRVRNNGIIDMSAAVQTTSSPVSRRQALQQALDRCWLSGGGTVTIDSGVEVELDQYLLIGSNTAFLASQSNIKMMAGATGPVVVNRNFQSPVITVTNGISDAAMSPVFPGRRIATCDCGSNVHGFIPGQHVLLKGDTTRRYIGVFMVFSTPSTTSFTILVGSKVSYGNSAGTVTAALADANILVDLGEVDFNGQNNQAYNWGAHAVLLNKVGNVMLRGRVMRDCTKYAYHIINSDSVTVRDTYIDSASDGVHFHAFTLNARVENLSGQGGDDFIAYTSSNAGYTQYDIPSGDMAAGGPLYGLTVRDVYCKRTTENAVAIHCDGALPVESVLIENVRIAEGAVKRHVVVDQTSTAASNPTAVKDVTVRNLYGVGTENLIKLGGQNTNATDQMLIDKFDVEGIYPAATLSYSNHAVNLDNVLVNRMIVRPKSDITFDITSSQRYLIFAGDQYSGWNELQVSDYVGRTTGSGQSHKIVAVTTGSPASKTRFRDCALYGTADFFAGAAAATPLIDIADCYNDAYSFLRINFTSKLRLTNVKSGTPGGVVPVLVFGSSATIDLWVNGLDSGNATNWLQVGTAAGDTLTLNAHITNISANPGSDPGVTWTSTSGTFNLRRSDSSYVVDNTKWTAISAGCITRNNAAGYSVGVGVYAQGPTAASRIAS